MKNLSLYLLLIISSIAQGQYAPGVKYVPNKYDIPASAFPVAKVSKAPSRAARAQLAASIPQLAWSAPIEIKKGGTYTGNWKSDDSGTPAVLISTYDPVEIVNSNIASSGEGIKMYGGTKVTVRRTNMYGQLPTGNNQWGRAINNYHPQYFIFENNYVEHTGGLLVDHSDENTKYLTIRYNLIRNTDRRRVDGSPAELRASILINSAAIGGEIAWNQFENKMDSSYVEDIINGGNVVATAANPLLIHDNFLFGAYPSPSTIVGSSQSGITIEGHPSVTTAETVSQFIRITNNQIISVCNGGLNLNAGHDISTGGNTIISSGMYPNGVQSNNFWGGKAIWNGSNTSYPSVFGSNLSSKGDTIGYARPDQSNPYKGRNDYVQVGGSPVSIQPGDNVSLPNVPITLAMEQAEWGKWAYKLKKNNITIGNAANNPTQPIDTLVTIANSVRVNSKIKGTITPVDSLGRAVTYKTGTINVSSDQYSTITMDPADEKTFYVTGFAPGASSITVKLITNNGKMLTKVVTVTVLPVLEEAVDLGIKFTQL